MATRDPLADWQALGQQYWQGLSELGNKFLKPQEAPNNPWAAGLEQWTKVLQGAGVAGTQQGAFEQLLEQGKSYVSTLEELFKAGSGSGMGAGNFDLGALARSSLDQFRQSQPWLAGMGEYGKWMDPATLEKLVGSLGGDPGSWLSMPAFGFNREQQERLQQLQADLLGYQKETQRYNALINKSLESAIKRLESKLGERSEPGRQLKSVKEVYDLWIDSLEESYAEVALSPEFREVYGALVNAQMRVKKGLQTQVERSTGEFGMPTRTELDGVHRKLTEVRRQLREFDVDAIENLRAELLAVKRELADLKQNSGDKRETVVVPRPARQTATAPAKTAETVKAVEPVTAAPAPVAAASKPKAAAKAAATPKAPAKSRKR